MPRIARIVAIGYPYHITQRGNYRQKAFIKRIDYLRYLGFLKEYSQKHRLLILAFCLMPNHVHYVAIPKKNNSMSATFNVCHMRHSQYFNKKRNLTGHLWQGRFYSCILDDKHLHSAVRYIENNPVRAGLVQRAKDWEWSSAKAHITKKKGFLPLENIDSYMQIEDWHAYLKEESDEAVVAHVKKCTLTGRPAGNSGFLLKLENKLGLCLQAPPRGRPSGK